MNTRQNVEICELLAKVHHMVSGALDPEMSTARASFRADGPYTTTRAALLSALVATYGSADAGPLMELLDADEDERTVAELYAIHSATLAAAALDEQRAALVTRIIGLSLDIRNATRRGDSVAALKLERRDLINASPFDYQSIIEDVEEHFASQG